MVLQYKKIGATTEGYRGKRAVLEERVIQGLKQPTFDNGHLSLTADTPQTLYFKSENISDGNYIILPDVLTLWNNWQLVIINDSNVEIPIYYFGEVGSLSLFKTVSAGTMLTIILVDNTATDQQGWTTLRTSDATIGNKYITTVLDTTTISYGQLMPVESQDTTTFKLSTILKGTPVKSIYIKPTNKFVGDSSLRLSIGTDSNHTLFYEDLNITSDVDNTNFSKDIFEQILSTQSDVDIYAYFSGSSLSSLESGSIDIIIERIKEIDPTVLNNAIVQTQLPIGTVLSYAFDANTPPEGFWPLNGSLVPNARAAIFQFVKKLEDIDNTLDVSNKLVISLQQWNQIYNTYGSCGKFAWSGSDLKFPAINCFIQGLGSIGTLNDLGKLIPAGLPNITGKVASSKPINSNNDPSVSGALYKTNGSTIAASQTNNGSGNDYSTIYLDASRSSSVYKNDVTTVQLQSIKFPYIISIYNKIQNAAYIDLLELKENSIDKANITLNNVSNTSGLRKLIEVYKNGSNWYKVFAEYDPSTGSFVGNWCEQGGSIAVTSGDNEYTVSLLKNYANTNYIVLKNYGSSSIGTKAMDAEVSCYTKTISSFKTHCNSDDTDSFDWYACGWIS